MQHKKDFLSTTIIKDQKTGEELKITWDYFGRYPTKEEQQATIKFLFDHR